MKPLRDARGRFVPRKVAVTFSFNEEAVSRDEFERRVFAEAQHPADAISASPQEVVPLHNPLPEPPYVEPQRVWPVVVTCLTVGALAGWTACAVIMKGL